MKNILNYDTQAEFAAAEENDKYVTSVVPGVAYVKENGNMGYNEPLGGEVTINLIPDPNIMSNILGDYMHSEYVGEMVFRGDIETSASWREILYADVIHVYINGTYDGDADKDGIIDGCSFIIKNDDPYLYLGSNCK